MEDYNKTALKNGHSGPLRLVYALSLTADWNAHFFARSDRWTIEIPQSKKTFPNFTKCSRSTEPAISIQPG